MDSFSDEEPQKPWSQDVGYDLIIEGRTLREWVDLVYKYECNQRKWKYMKLALGSFGAEIIAVSVLAMRNADDVNENEYQLATQVHQAWSRAYVHWRDHPPPIPPYRLPYNPLGDDHRNQCASLTFSNLSDEEKEKDLIVVEAFLAARRENK